MLYYPTDKLVVHYLSALSNDLFCIKTEMVVKYPIYQCAVKAINIMLACIELMFLKKSPVVLSEG